MFSLSHIDLAIENEEFEKLGDLDISEMDDI